MRRRIKRTRIINIVIAIATVLMALILFKKLI